MTKINKGFVTEQDHHAILSQKFTYCSSPKNTCVGSDFIVIRDGSRAAIESKSANTDIFEFGTLNTFSNGMIFGASQHINQKQLELFQEQIRANSSVVSEYFRAVGASEFPHPVAVADYNRIKDESKLIHIRFQPPTGTSFVTTSFAKSSSNLVKANYLAISDRMFCIEGIQDPLNLEASGASTISDDHIDYVTLRSARNGSKNGRSTVSLRVQFRLKRKLPETKLRIQDI